MLHMLHNDPSRSFIESEQLAGQDDQGGFGSLINFALSFVRRQWLLILFVTALALASSWIYLKITPPTFTAKAKVLLGNQKVQFVQQQSIMADSPLDLANIESQLQILQSKAIAAAVIRELKLTDDPDFNASDQPLPKFLERIKRMLGGAPAKQDVRPAEVNDDIIAAFQGRLSAAKVGFSNVIEISYSSSNPQRAAQIVNAVANTYIADQLNAKFEAARMATAWLQDRLRDLGQQALTTERAVSTFRSQNNIVSIDGKLMDEQQVAELNSRLVAARAQTSDAQARVDRFQAALKASGTGLNSTNPTLDASVSDTLNSTIISTLRQQYLDYARREADWSARFGRDHLAVVNLRTKMRDMRTSIQEEVRRLAETSKSDYEVAKQRQEAIEKQLARAIAQSRTSNSVESTMRELETSAKGYRNLYDNFLQRYMGAVQQTSFPVTEARVISPAAPPQSKSKPKTTLILVLGLFGGLALGTALGLLRDTMDRVFRTGSQVEAQLHIPCLSLIPLMKEVEPKQIPRGQPSEKPSGQRIMTRSGTSWAATDMPLSRFAESIRAIKLAVDLNVTSASNKVIGITSSLPDEGKSTIAAALAQLTAHTGSRAILVDCDLRNPSLSRNLSPGATAGIIEVMSGKCPLDEAIWTDPKTNLSFLPTVKKKPLFHTSEILSALATKRLFDELRAKYDYIVVDLPPLAPVIDVRATTQLIDCFILAIEWGGTKTDVVQHALQSAPNLHGPLIGAVLNKTDMKAMSRYDSYHSDYYNNKHYARYGYTS